MGGLVMPWDDLTKPINIIFLCLAVLSIVISISLFFLSQKRRSIAFAKARKPYKIFDSTSSTPKLKVLDENDDPISENVYLIEVMLWNSGDLPIEPAEVRIPVCITLSPCSKILDYKIIQQPHPEIANIRLTEEIDPANSQKKLLCFQWEHLDPKFGAKVQVIYAGTEDTEIGIIGYIVGVSAFVDESQEAIYRYIPSRYHKPKLLNLVPGSLLIIYFVVILALVSMIGVTDPYSSIIALILGLCLSILSGLILFHRRKPPF
jgi:hypothetical protein